MTMKRLTVLFCFILFSILFGMKERVELNVKVTARVVESLKIQEVEDLKVNERMNGDIDLSGKIRTLGAGRVLVTWKDSDEIEYEELNENSKISLDMKSKKTIADIRMTNMESSIIDLGKYKEKMYELSENRNGFSNKITMGKKSGDIVVDIEHIGRN